MDAELVNVKVSKREHSLLTQKSRLVTVILQDSMSSPLSLYPSSRQANQDETQAS